MANTTKNGISVEETILNFQNHITKLTDNFLSLKLKEKKRAYMDLCI